MGKPVKFLFDTQFAVDPKRVVEPKLSLAEHEAQLGAAREQARAEGYAAGRAAAEQSAAQAQATALTAIADRIGAAAAGVAALQGALEREAIEIGVGVGRTLADALTKRYPLAEIRALAEECFANLRSAPHLVVRVNDDLLPIVQDELTRLAAERGFEGRLIFLAEPTIGFGDAHVEWATGGMAIDRAEIGRFIAEAVERHLDGIQHHLSEGRA